MTAIIWNDFRWSGGGVSRRPSLARTISVMFIQIRQSADHGFDQPLGLLTDCHRRIEQFLGVLLTVARTRHGGVMSDDERRAAERALQYFQAAAPRHTADEEASLFPRLRGCAGSEADAARLVLDELEADHRVAERGHAAVHESFTAWLAAGTLPKAEADGLLKTLDDLQAGYARHIAIEDRELFPLASRLLPAADVEAVGREMAERRGVPFRTVL